MQSKIQTTDQGGRPERQSFIEIARRKQIIECAITAIAELGYAQASLAQIAKRAGVSTGVISYYFAGKDELIDAVIHHVYATGEAIVRPRASNQPTERASLRGFIEGSVDFVRTHPNYMRAVKNISRGGAAPADGLLLDRPIDEPRRSGLQRIFEQGQGNGEFRAFSPRVMAVTLVEAIDAISLQLDTHPDMDLTAYAAELVELFDRATRKTED